MSYSAKNHAASQQTGIKILVTPDIASISLGPWFLGVLKLIKAKFNIDVAGADNILYASVP